MRFQILRMILMGSILLSCQKEPNDQNPEQEFTLYLIPQGFHSSFNGIQWINSDSLGYEAYFDSSCIYQALDTTNQRDINKLFGFSDCGEHHHESSARFGWRWYQDQIQIFTYCYREGISVYEFVRDVDIGRIHHFKIAIADSTYLFYIDGIQVAEEERSADCSEGLNYMLWPYFGGDEVAPHDIRIYMR